MNGFNELVNQSVGTATHLSIRVARTRFEADYLICCYLKANKNMDRAAEIAGLSSRSAMYRIMKRHGVYPWDSKNEEIL